MKRFFFLLFAISVAANIVDAQEDGADDKRMLLAKSDSLFAVGVDLYDADKYQEAIPIFAQSDQIDKAVLDPASNRRDYSSWWLASCYYQLGDSVKASETNDYYNVTPVDRRLTVKSDSLSALAWTAWDGGNLQSAVQYAIQCAEIEKYVVGEKHIWYGNSVEIIVLFYCAMGDYISAAEYEQIAQSIKGQILWEDIIDIANSWHKLASFLGGNGYYSEASKLGEQTMAIRKHVLGKEHPDYANSLNNLATYYAGLGNYEDAIRLGTEALNIIEKVYGKESPYYALSLDNLAGYHGELGNYTEAIRLGTEALNIREKVYGKESPDYAQSLNNLAGYYGELGNHTEAIRLDTEALNIREKILGKEHPDYALTLNDLATYNYYLDNYEEAVRLGTEALNIREKVYGKEHPYYATTLGNLAGYYGELGNYTEAIKLATEALNIREKVYGKEHPDYALLLNNIASYLYDLGNYAEAIKLSNEALNIYEKVYGKEHPDYAGSLNNIASCYASLGNYSEAIKLGTEAINIYEKFNLKGHPDYARSLNNLASYNSSLGNYVEAIRLGTEALNIYEKVYGKEHTDYATSLSNLAGYHSELGNYKEAIRLGTEAINIRDKVYGKVHSEYATSLSNLAFYNSSLGNYSEAIRLVTEAMNVLEKLGLTEHPLYTITLNNLADYNSSLGNYSEAIRLGTEALSIRAKVLGEEHPDYAGSLNNLASCNASLGNYSEAIKLGTEAINIYEKTFGREHPDYAMSLNNLAGYSFDGGIWQLANYYSVQSSKLTSALIKKTFADLTAAQRTMFWGMYNGWYEMWIHRFSYSMPSDTLSLNGYNGVLLSKGLLLNSDIEFSKLIQESGDREALAMYEDIKMLRLQINKLREKPISERFANVDSLERIAQTKESTLIERSKVYGDYTKNLVITWEQVQEKLSDKDIAVEFVSFPLNADSTMYIAYALKKDWEYPKMIPLFEEKDLQAVRARGSVYGNDEVSKFVWKPLDEMMKEVENVYFAPSGELYNIAIESIPTHEDGGQTLVGEHRNYYRLSSTRELALIKDKNSWHEAAVYGGLQYGMSVEDMIHEDGKYEKRNAATRSDSSPSYYITREDREGRDVGVEIQPLSYLKGTREEAIAIKEDLERQLISTQLFTDSIGTETSFKDLHGRKTSIIHIGTHGFFNDRKKKYEENNLQLLGMNQQAKVIEDDALTRSGLYFAGADNARINGSKAIPDSIDDGKLTALEIAQLDLRGLDLVVLSACQTGLGEITGDGVFGLQRGFKKAGAQTIVMSLWKVDDEATTEFMTTFFENIKIEDGHPTNKYQAFKTAQEELRKKKDKYSDKNCWAAFVMLDGIR